MTARDHALPSGSVMNANMINADRCHAEIARLRNVAGGEYAIRRLDGCGADLVQAHAAKVALTTAPQLICMPYAIRTVSVRNQAS